MLGLLDEAVNGGADPEVACKELGVSLRTVQRWKKLGIGEDRRAGPKTQPENRMSEAEVRKILDVANSLEYRHLSPKQIVPILADKGIYIASESSIYRILRRAGQLHHRTPAKPPSKPYRPSEKVATGPNQVWSWDITYLKGSVRGKFYFLYMIMDVWSRKIVGQAVEAEETAELAAPLFERACQDESVPKDILILHSDRGGPMKGSTLLAKLQELGVTPSYGRPRVSDDNPYSESLFRTLKYRPQYPRLPFGSLEEARRWVADFKDWYNTEHRHSGIKFVTPEERHMGLQEVIMAKRQKVYEEARRRNPKRWSKGIRNWTPIEIVCLNPAPKKDRPEAAA